MALCLPLIVWVVQWAMVDWIPQGDQALIAMRTQEVFSAHPPLLGMRSTSAITVPGADAHHLGPIQFYLMAPVYFVFGWRPIGLVVAGALLAAAFVAVSIRTAWRIGRWPAVLATGAAALGAELFIGSPIVLPWNPYPPVLGLLAVLVTAWALLRGTSRALPWFVAATSFVLQANLVFVPILAPLIVAMLGMGLTRWYVWRGTVWPLPGSGSSWDEAAWWRRPGPRALAVGLLCWLPSIVELFVLHPNNAQELGEFFAGMIGGRQIADAVGGLIAVAALMVMTLRRGRPSVAVGAVCVAALGLAGLAAGYVTGGSARVHYLFMATAAVTFAVVAAGLLAWERLMRSSSARANVGLARLAVPIVAALGGVLAATAAVIGPNGAHPTGATDEERVNSDTSRAAVERATELIRAKVFGRPPVEVLGGGYQSAMGDVPALMLYLQSRGYPVYTPNAWPNSEGEERYDPRHAPEKRVRIQLSDGKAPEVSIPWEWPSVQPTSPLSTASPSAQATPAATAP